MAKSPITMEYTSERIKALVSKKGVAHGRMIYYQESNRIEQGIIFTFLYEFSWGTAKEFAPYEENNSDLAEVSENPVEKGKSLLEWNLKDEDLEVIISSAQAGSANIEIYGEIKTDTEHDTKTRHNPAPNETLATNRGEDPRLKALRTMRERGLNLDAPEE